MMPSDLLFTAIPVIWYMLSHLMAIWLFWRWTPGDHGGFLWRRRQRLLRERGLCLKCGYDLTGNVTGVCSECGTEVCRGYETRR